MKERQQGLLGVSLVEPSLLHGGSDAGSLGRVGLQQRQDEPHGPCDHTTPHNTAQHNTTQHNQTQRDLEMEMQGITILIFFSSIPIV
jgi:hypothetical protein